MTDKHTEQPVSKWIPTPNAKLQNRLFALQAVAESKPDDKRLNVRIERISALIAQDEAQQEQQYLRATGQLARPRRTPSLATMVRFTPSTSVPRVSEKRKPRHAIEEALGYRLSGRQWSRMARVIKRLRKLESE